LGQVFISYKKEDRALADEFKSRIEKAGFQVWMDTELHAGTEWRNVIDDEIRKSIAVVVIMTTAAKSSEYVTYEWAFAYGAGVRVIPVIYLAPEDLHPRISGLQHLDFRGRRRPWGVLIKALNDANTVPSLKIHRAVWGPREYILDVTTKVERRVSDSRVTMQANRDVFQDPLHGKKKILFVFYSKHGTPRVVEVLEHDDLDIT
jgi:TIR domain-containing protein